jgi:DNA polymerase-4
VHQGLRPTGEVIAGEGPLGPGEADGLGVLHADLDAFYASVEVLKDPSLRGRPLLVGGTGGRGVVTSASYEARAFGCRNAMPMARARRLCPQAVAIPPDFAAYRRHSATVMRIFASVTPLVEPLALDEAFLDVRGARALFGDAVAIARLLRSRVREEAGLTLTVGVAASKYLAKLASTRGKPDGLLVVPPGRALRFLHPLPVDALWGAGRATIEVLHRYGLRTVGDVAATPRATLERALGPAVGAQLHELAWARDDREVVPFEAPKSVGSEETFAADIDDPEQLAREVLRCCARVGRRLREAGLAGRTVTLKLRFADFRTITRGRTLPVATDTDPELHAVAGELLARLQLGRSPVRLVGVTVSNLQRAGAPVQLRLGPERPGWEAAVRAADAVRARFGEGAIDLASLTGDRPAEAYQEARQTPRPRRQPLVPSDLDPEPEPQV